MDIMFLNLCRLLWWSKAQLDIPQEGSGQVGADIAYALGLELHRHWEVEGSTQEVG